MARRERTARINSNHLVRKSGRSKRMVGEVAPALFQTRHTAHYHWISLGNRAPLSAGRVGDALLREARLSSTRQLLLLRRSIAGCLRVPLTFSREALQGRAGKLLLVCLGLASGGCLGGGAERGER